jgi:hypothetical protein
MKHWSLVALGLLAMVGCRRNVSNDDTTTSATVDQLNLTGATVSRIPITPPPAIDESATSEGEPTAEEMSPEPFWTPPAMTTTSAGASGTPVNAADQMVNAPPPPPARPGRARSTPARRSTFPETSFGSMNTESATGAAFPESSFGDYNTPAPGSANRALDAGASLPNAVNVR